jgi:F-type H+-transporting ATPase subunit delta
MEPGAITENFGKGGAAEEAPAGVATLNFFVPHEVIASGVKVDIVEVPTATGYFGIKSGHVPTIAQLAPGVVTVHPAPGEKEFKKYFVSSGFAFCQGSSVDICAVEAVPVEQLDADAVREGLKAAQDKLSAKQDDYEAAVAQIQIDTFSAMARVIGA